MKVEPDGSENAAVPGAAAGLRDAARGTRLQRVLADAGVGSRRACEEMIAAGRVSVNGTVVRELPAWVDPGRDQIRVDGRVIEKPEPHLYLMFNKPARTLATPREGPDDARRSVMDLVSHPLSSRLFPAGRLDFEATGLLLLTNDGELANRLTHARYGVEKTYQLVVRGTLDDASLERINKVVGQVTKRAAKEAGAPRPAMADLSILAREPGRTVLELSSRDGRAALVRDTLAALGHPVKKMERVAIGPVRLRAVAVGQWRELERDELNALRRAASGKGAAAEMSGRGGGGPVVAEVSVSDDRTGGEEQAVAPVKPRVPRRLRRAAAPERPSIAKRFRGIGKPIEDEKARARRRGTGRGLGRGSRPAGSDGPGAPAAIGDRRRGRGDAINAYRKKAASGAGSGGIKRAGREGTEDGPREGMEGRPRRVPGGGGGARRDGRGGSGGAPAKGRSGSKRGPEGRSGGGSAGGDSRPARSGPRGGGGAGRSGPGARRGKGNAR